MKANRHGDPDADGGALPAVAALSPLTDRVNADPPILGGMTAAEGVRIAVLCLLVYGVVGLIILGMTGLWPAALVVTLFGTLGTTWYASLYLAKVKRGRPEGYYALAIHLWLAGRGFVKSKYLLHPTYWSVGRFMPFGGFESPLVVRERPAKTPRPSSPRKNAQ